MKSNRSSLRFVEGMLHNAKSRFISGLLLLIPLGITALVVRFLYSVLTAVPLPILRKALGVPSAILGIIAVFSTAALIYLLGLVATHVVGKRMVAFAEGVLLKTPLVRTIYSASRQVVDMLTGSSPTTFKSVVMLEFPRQGLKSIGFMTGELTDENGRDCYNVFVPTAPNPTSGFLLIVPREQVVKTTMAVEDGIKMIISGGILSPDRLTRDETPSVSSKTEAL